jgi:hypothetical protein
VACCGQQRRWKVDGGIAVGIGFLARHDVGESDLLAWAEAGAGKGWG